MKNGTANVISLGYAYGDGMNLTAVNDNVAAANNVALTYSAVNRLLTAKGVWGTSTYAYDKVGNRTLDQTVLGTTTTTNAQTYGTTNNRLTALTTNGAANRSYAYDGAGNIISDTRPGEAFAFTYNNRNRPVTVTRNGTAYASYGYNALQQLVGRSTSAAGGPSGTVHYLYDSQGHLLAEADAATGTTQRDYIWAAANDNETIDLPLAVAEAATLYMVHTDHLGRPIRMTDATKVTVWQASYKPWGDVQTLSGSKTLNLRWPGQYFQIGEVDQKTIQWIVFPPNGYAYNWHRHYDPTTGRYTQPDPLRFIDGPSMYAYAGSSPWMNTDSEGLYTEVVVWDGVGHGASSFGHVSTNINGKNYSWAPGGWDTQYPQAMIYNLRQQQFRRGTGYILNLTPSEEDSLARCLRASQQPYGAISNNCVNPPQQCLPSRLELSLELIFPQSLGEQLLNSPAFVGTVRYPFPPEEARQ